MGVRFGKLSPYTTDPLFEKNRKRLELLAAQDRINNKYGAHALERIAPYKLKSQNKETVLTNRRQRRLQYFSL